MSKTISLNMWISIVPDHMYNGWVENGLIADGARAIVERNDKYSGKFSWLMQRKEGSPFKDITNKAEYKKLEKQGWRLVSERFNIDSETIAAIYEEIGIWYLNIFQYIETWLTKNKFINLKKGSFRGGFLATNKEDRTTMELGAPLSKKGNKVAQIKEKFGAFVVYFEKLTDAEAVKVSNFAKHCESKFDCSTYFV